MKTRIAFSVLVATIAVMVMSSHAIAQDQSKKPADPPAKPRVEYIPVAAQVVEKDTTPSEEPTGDYWVKRGGVLHLFGFGGHVYVEPEGAVVFGGGGFTVHLKKGASFIQGKRAGAFSQPHTVIYCEPGANIICNDPEVKIIKTSEITFKKIEKKYTLSGVVKNEKGEPAAGVVVSVFGNRESRLREKPLQQTTTDHTGEFKFTLEKEATRLQANFAANEQKANPADAEEKKPLRPTKSRSSNEQNVNPTDVEEVEGPWGEDTTIEIVKKGLIAVKGTVTDAAGKPLASAPVLIYFAHGNEDEREETVFTDLEGRYELRTNREVEKIETMIFGTMKSKAGPWKVDVTVNFQQGRELKTSGAP